MTMQFATPALLAPRMTADFEARSEIDLTEVGAWKYSEDPSTKIICLSYAFGNEPAKLWTPWLEEDVEVFFEEKVMTGRGKTKVVTMEKRSCMKRQMVYRPELCPFPQEIIDFIAAGGVIEAHSAQMERSLWLNQLHRKLGVPMPTRWLDTQATCAYRGLPLSLDDVGEVLNLDVLKDKEGKTLIRLLCKPQKITKKMKIKQVWNNDPDLFKKMFLYCMQDVNAERSLAHAIGDLTPSEYRLWVLDQTINYRGVRLDFDAVYAAKSVVEKATMNMEAELVAMTNGEITTGGQRDRIVEWLKREHKIEMPNMQAGTLKETLKDRNIPVYEKGKPETYARRMLEIRRELSRTSTDKIYTMIACVCHDGRIRGLLQYHGAGTGRWAGRLVQPQNFPRPKIMGKPFKGKIDDLIAILMFEDPAVVNLCYGPEMEAIAAALRGMFIAADGCEFLTSDFSSIEARIVLWLAGQTEAMDIFNLADAKKGPDIYCHLAGQIYGRRIDKEKDADERQLGKIGVLGCFGPDTLVLTPRGAIPILQVGTDDRVWDGHEWVSHEGVICQGEQATINLSGVAVTPDHKVYLGRSSRPAGYLARKELAFCRALENATESLPSLAIYVVREAALQLSRSNALAARSPIGFLSRTSTKGEALDATLALRNDQATGRNGIAAMLTSWLTTGIGLACSTASQLASIGAVTRTTATSNTTEAGVFSSTRGGKKTAVVSSDTWSLCVAGTTRCLKWIGATWTRGINQAIFASSLEGSMQATNAALPGFKHASSNSKLVYDIVNAGARHHFTIITERGPLLVSNCGYQMGAARLQEQAHDDYELDLELELCQRIVSTYRETYDKVPIFWNGINRTACDAVIKNKPMTYRGITYEPITDHAGKWLACRLPSGRRIWYYNPSITMEPMPWNKDDIRPKLWYEGRDNKRGGMWSLISTYGGMLTENIVQAIARDIMCEAMLRAELAGYKIILTVHDEIVSEIPIGWGSQQEFDALMAQNPVWCQDMPIAVEGWRGPRYKK